MPTEPEVVAHLCRRAGFGASLEQIDALSSLDLEAIVDGLISASAPADLPPPVLSDAGASGWDRWTAALVAWLDRMATTSAPLEEKLALFWHGHFVSSVDKVGDMALMWRQVACYRALGAGNLRTLTQAMAIQPAMIRYLDNATNVAGGPNQNFARELFELFLLGVGNYTEDDIDASARAWTGHGLDSSDHYSFQPSQHDAGLKTIFGVTATYDGPDVINTVFDTPDKQWSCARFIVAKLWAFFAHNAPSPAVINTLANVLIRSHLEIRPTLRALFLHPEFYEPITRQGLLRSPIEWCVLLMRVTGLSATETHPEWTLPAMGQSPFAPPNVGGWSGNRSWISTAAAQARANHAAHVAWQAEDIFADLADMPVARAAHRALAAFGVTRPSARTLDALVAWQTAQRRSSMSNQSEQRGLFILVALCPEVQLA